MSPNLGWIWPKDPRPGNPSHWPRRWRFLDVLTNKGPDIYVGVINGPKSTRPRRGEWSRWDNGNALQDENDSPGRGRGRQGGEKYDFRRRKYAIPDEGTWSGVEYCTCEREGRRRGRRVRVREKHVVPRRFWDANGEVYPAGYWHDVIYGGGRGGRF